MAHFRARRDGVFSDTALRPLRSGWRRLPLALDWESSWRSCLSATT
jgi:hypothetical protein